MFNATPRPLYPRDRDPVAITQDAGWNMENASPTGIRSPACSARSQPSYSSLQVVFVCLCIVLTSRLIIPTVKKATCIGRKAPLRHAATRRIAVMMTPGYCVCIQAYSPVAFRNMTLRHWLSDSRRFEEPLTLEDEDNAFLRNVGNHSPRVATSRPPSIAPPLTPSKHAVLSVAILQQLVDLSEGCGCSESWSGERGT